jgi:Flp pilus assembly protein TadB
VTATGVLAALSGATTATGLVLLVRTLTGPPRRGPAARWPASLVRLWQAAGGDPAAGRRHRAVFAASLLAGAITWLFTGLPVLALVASAAVPGLPWLLAAGSAERRAVARVEAVGDWTRRLRDVAETGAGLQAAIIASAATAPAVIAGQVGALAGRLQAGWQAHAALLRFADEINDPVGDQIVAALLLHLKDRGDKLGAVLTAIATAAARDVAMRKEADAERASARFAIRFMTGLSALAVGVAVLSGEYLQPYATPTGQVLMVVLAGLFVGLLWWVRRLSRPAPAPRLLARAGGGAGR